MRIINCLAIYLFTKETWPQIKTNAVWIAFLSLTYPGFLISFQPLTFLFQYLQSVFFFLSLWLTTRLVKKQMDLKNIPEWALSVVLGGISLIISEYFYFLEWLRIGAAWFVVHAMHQAGTERQKIASSRIFILLLPHLIIFIAVSAWRLISQPQISRLETDKLYSLLADPASWITGAYAFFDGVIISGVKAWVTPVWKNLPGFAIGSFVFVTLFSLMCKNRNSAAQKTSILDSGFFKIFLFGCIWCGLAALPFWLGNVHVTLGMVPENRFLLPAAFGSACMVFGAAGLIPWQKLKLAVLIIFALQAAGVQIWAQIAFSQARMGQNEFFRQIRARIPAVPSGTLFVFNDNPLWMQSENSISAVLNLIYLPEGKPGYIDVYAYYDKERFNNEISEIKAPNETADHLIGSFTPGNGQILLIELKSEGCLRVTDDKDDFFGWNIPQYKAADEIIAKNVLIDTDELVHTYFSDASKSFCERYQKAEYEASTGNWDRALILGDELLKSDYNDHFKYAWVLAIQANLEKGFCGKAIALTRSIAQKDRSMSKILCELWRNYLLDISDAQVNSFLGEELFCKLEAQP